MAQVVPTSIIFAIAFLAAMLLLLSSPISYFTNPTIANQLNTTQQNITTSFYDNIYTPQYNAAFNSSGGFKASGTLQTFTGLALMFGAFYQEMTSIISGPNILNTGFSWLYQYVALPSADIFALLGIFTTTMIIFLIWHGIANWTKVED